MSTRREEMLKEMGVTPLWRLRNHELLPLPLLNAGNELLPPPLLNAEEGSNRRLRSQTEVGAEHSIPAAAASTARVANGGASYAVAPAPPARAMPPAPTDDRRAGIMRMEWPALKDAVAQCVACPLHARRNKTVFGVGDENADWMFIGEGPGAEEDAKGEPFVGQAGRLLDSMLAAIKLKRGENVYVANVVKCRPPGNRNPEPEEALKCEPYLHRQIDLIKPKLLIGLGRVAANNLLARDASIASLRGRVHEYKGIPLIITYHPAYLLRTLNDKSKAWEDLCFAVRTMQGLQSGGNAAI